MLLWSKSINEVDANVFVGKIMYICQLYNNFSSWSVKHFFINNKVISKRLENKIQPIRQPSIVFSRKEILVIVYLTLDSCLEQAEGAGEHATDATWLNKCIDFFCNCTYVLSSKDSTCGSRSPDYSWLSSVFRPLVETLENGMNFSFPKNASISYKKE
jgi:hypothetical protein